MKARFRAFVAGAVLCVVPVAISAQQSHHHAEAGAAAHIGERAPLLEHIGNLHHAVSTKDAMVQRYFDQGLMMVYAFNHMEAERSFRSAAALDPQLAMAWWGVALAVGPNLNDATSMEKDQKGREAIAKAKKLKKYASPEERALIDAMSKRYGAKSQDQLPKFADRYAAAMAKVAARYPDDPDARTLSADAWMNTMPWDYYNADGSPKAGTTKAIAELEAVMQRWPQHPGANHLYIHAEEAQHPELAVGAAERLGPYAPAAGHLVHMPSHIWVRVGRWQDASAANENATKADEDYITQCHVQGRYPLGYYPHNLHMLTFASMMEGRSAAAMTAAKKAAGQMPVNMQEDPPSYAAVFESLPLFAMVRFGHWDEVLAYPKPLDKKGFVIGMWQYARAVAMARTGKLDDAAKEIAALDETIKLPAMQDFKVHHNESGELLELARDLAAGELDIARKDSDTGIKKFQDAVAVQDKLAYSEPENWFYPARQSLGDALLKAGKNEEAEKVFREDVKRHPNNGWSLFGLEQSLRAQGKTAEADEVEGKFQKAWARADVKLTAAVF